MTLTNRTNAGKFFRNAVSHVTVVALVASSMANVLLARRLTMIRGARDEMRIGAIVPAMKGTSIAGNEVLVSFSNSLPTVVYHFSPTCSWCERNWENVRALIQQTRGRYRVVGVSSANLTEAFLKERGIEFDDVLQLTPETYSALKLSGTPRTIVVSEEARVLRNWSGAYSRDLESEVSNYFSAQLPGFVVNHAAPAILR